jgi:uncharacterized protein YdhG (YjbR/CyaY superfamily)
MTIDEYLEGHASPAQRKILEGFRQMVKEMVPEAEESISYGVPTFKLKKRPLIYFAAFTNHMSIYPTSDEMIEALGEEVIGKFRTGRGTLQFTEENPIPEPVMRDIINFRLAQTTGR